MSFQHLALFLHLIGVVTWVGGMAFAYLCLRPAAGMLSPAERLALWQGVLERFFRLVWVSIALILLSGFGVLASVGFGNSPTAWHVMMLVGLVMIAIFVSLWFGAWPRLKRAVADQSWKEGAAALGVIRQRVAINLSLGVFNIATATLGLAY